MKNFVAAAAAILCVLASATNVWAQDIVQDDWSIGTQLQQSLEVGQSFVAITSKIESVGFRYSDSNPFFGSAQTTVSLHQGDSPDGAVIASVSRDLAGINGWADFDFSDIELLTGHPYTMTITSASDRGFYHYATSNPYAGGRFFLNGSAQGDQDLQFRVLGSGVCDVIEISDGEIEFECPSGETLTVDDFSCTTADNGDGTYTLSCGDGTSVTIADGQDGVDGQDGEDGSSCAVTDNGDGTATIACDDGSSATVADGEDGTSCSVTDNGDGTSTIECEDGTTATVADGEDGQDGQDGIDGVDGTSCTIEDHDDGSATFYCDDGTSFTVANGEDGADGQDGVDGTGCVAEDLGEGDYSITCENEEEIIISDGEDGGSCIVEDHDDGSATIYCDDGSSFTVANGQDGEDGGCSTTNGSPATPLAFMVLVGTILGLRRKVIMPRA